MTNLNSVQEIKYFILQQIVDKPCQTNNFYACIYVLKKVIAKCNDFFLLEFHCLKNCINYTILFQISLCSKYTSSFTILKDIFFPSSSKYFIYPFI